MISRQTHSMSTFLHVCERKFAPRVKHKFVLPLSMNYLGFLGEGKASFLDLPWLPPRAPWLSNSPSKKPSRTHIGVMTSFFIVFINFVLVRLTLLLRNAIKTDVFVNDFENALLVSVSHFCSFRGSKDPSRTPFGEHTAPFWAPLTPPKILKPPP